MDHNIYLMIGGMERITKVCVRHLWRASLGGTDQEIVFAARAEGGGARHMNSGRRALWVEREDKDTEAGVGLGSYSCNQEECDAVGRGRQESISRLPC